MRRTYLDNIRSLDTIAMVLWHVAFLFSGMEPTYGSFGPFKAGQLTDMYIYIIYPWMLPIFFIAAGVGAKLFLEQHSEKDFIHTRTQKLLIPSTVGLFVFQFIAGYYNVEMVDAFTVMHQVAPRLASFIPDYIVYVFAGISALWFIHTLWLLSMALIPLRRWEKGRLSVLCKGMNMLKLLLLMIPYYLMSQILNTPYAILYRFGTYLFLFLSGYYIFSDEGVFEVLKKNCGWLLCVGIVLEAVYTVRTFGHSPIVDPYARNLCFCVTSWVMILALLGVAKKYLDKKTKFLSFLKRESWGLYVLHYLPLVVCSYYLRHSSLGNNPYICYPLAAIAAFGGAYVLKRIISRIPFFSYCVLGMPARRKKHGEAGGAAESLPLPEQTAQ